MIGSIANTGKGEGMALRTLFLIVVAAYLTSIGCAGGGTDGSGSTNATGFVYVANSNSNTISTFSITSSTGVVGSAATPVVAGTQPQQVVLDTAGQFAFVANSGSGNLSRYLVNTAGGLSSLGVATTVGTTPLFPTVDPLNRYLFVPNSGSNNLSVFTLNAATGALTPVANSPYPTGSNPQTATLDSQGRFVWVNNLSAGTVSMFFINTGGSLSPAPGIIVAPGTSPQRVAFLTLGTRLFAYVANAGDGTVSAYEVDQTTGGVVGPVPGSPFPAGTSPNLVVIDPTGQLALVSNVGSSNISVYRINASNGALTAVQNPGPPSSNFFPSGQNPQAVTIHPTGNFAFVAGTTSGIGTVSVYTVTQPAGVLTQVSGSPFSTGGTNPQRVTIDSAGKVALVSNRNSDTIAMFSIDQTTGVLTPAIGSPFSTGNAPEQATATGSF